MKIVDIASIDEIIETHLTEISNKFHNRLVELGLRPKETFEEYMGSEFKNEPKPTYEQLLERVDYNSKQYKNIKKRFETDLSSVPQTIKENELNKIQTTINELWISIKNKEYQISKEDKQYAKDYHKKHDAYWDMWKD